MRGLWFRKTAVLWRKRHKASRRSFFAAVLGPLCAVLMLASATHALGESAHFSYRDNVINGFNPVWMRSYIKPAVCICDPSYFKGKSFEIWNNRPVYDTNNNFKVEPFSTIKHGGNLAARLYDAIFNEMASFSWSESPPIYVPTTVSRLDCFNNEIGADICVIVKHVQHVGIKTQICCRSFSSIFKGCVYFNTCDAVVASINRANAIDCDDYPSTQIGTAVHFSNFIRPSCFSSSSSGRPGSLASFNSCPSSEECRSNSGQYAEDGDPPLIFRGLCRTSLLARISIFSSWWIIALILINAGFGRIVAGNDCGPWGLPGYGPRPRLFGFWLSIFGFFLAIAGLFLTRVLSHCT